MDSVDLNVLRSVLQWRRAGQRVMLYSVVQTWGSAPRPPGAMLALRGDGEHLVSLDVCIETMRQTGNDMHEKYKETSLGGLAVNVPNC